MIRDEDGQLKKSPKHPRTTAVSAAERCRYKQCGKRRRKDYKYCESCYRIVKAQMISSGYLTPDWGDVQRGRDAPTLPPKHRNAFDVLKELDK